MEPVHRHVSARRGESAPFHFVTRWTVARPLPQVWTVLTDVGSWPLWWEGMDAVQQGPAAPGAGDKVSIVVGSPLGPVLRFDVELVSVEEPSALSFVADGDLRGTGSWSAHQVGAETRMDIVWCVVSRKWSVRALRPFAAWAHRRVMEAGERGLRAVLD